MNSYFSSISSATAEEGCNSSDKPPSCSEVSETVSSFDPCYQLFSDRYRILKVLGQGGFGKTFLAVDHVLRELLPVLQYLHDHHIIHRDIKPANIICRNAVKSATYHKYEASQTGHRQLVLVDFGAAKHLAEGRSADLGTLIGSAEYAAPEQTRGHAVFASDLYSLGLTCLYLLTQMSPFDLYDMSEGEWQWQAYLTHPISP